MPLFTHDVIGSTPIIGATAGSVLFAGTNGVFQQDNANLFWDDANNFLGIGTAAPATVLHFVSNSSAAARAVQLDQYSDDGQSALFRGRKARGTSAIPAGVQSGDLLFEFAASGNDTTGFLEAARIQVVASRTWGENSGGSEMQFYTMADSTAINTQRMVIDQAGKVGIGTTAPSTLLHVGLAGTTLGTIGLAGNTSGLITMNGAAAAGTWTFTLPTTGGTADYALTTNGSGTSTWAQISLTAGVTGILPVANGGTGQTTYTNGQLLIGNTTGNTLTKATLTGTANQVVVTNGTGTITLSTPQDIATGSSPTFTDLTLSGGDLIASTATTFNVFNTVATTVNAFGAATTLELGAATGTTSINNALTVDGNTTLGNASGDAVTFNAATVTFANDTDFVTSGGVNGLSIDGTTFSVDGTNNRVGIGTAAPAASLHVAGGNIAISNNNGVYIYQSDGTSLRELLSISSSDIIEYGNVNLSSQHRFFTWGLEVAALGVVHNFDNERNVGINTATTSVARLYVNGGDNAYTIIAKIDATSANITTADTFIGFTNSAGAVIGSIAGTAVEGVIAYNTFTGSHYTQVDQRDGLEPLVLLCSTGERMEEKEVTREKQKEKQTDVKEMETVTTEVKEHLVKTQICNHNKCPKVLGVWGGIDREKNDLVFALGTGYVLVLNTGLDLFNGGFVHSTDIKAGRVVKQEDDLLHNYTVAKLLKDVIWLDGEKERKVSVTYHCG